ncbi:MAG: hypothetical protein ACP5PK_03840 [candidate division WOR-3 bacterium]|jgi:hypothetical protein
MWRRLLVVLLTVIALLSFLFAALTGGFTRIFYFSTQICLSCMGLV